MKKCLCTIVLLNILLHPYAQSSSMPAFPLITHDPYFSIWSTTNQLTASTTKHWTGADHSLIGMLKVDGVAYRFLGKAGSSFKTIVPASDELNYEAAYTTEAPADGWMKPGFDDSYWKKGSAPFGNDKAISKTIWLTKDIWVRREFSINTFDLNKLFLKLQHDDDVEVYLNGEPVYQTKGWTSKFIFIPINEAIKTKLQKEKNILAIHVINNVGGAWLDAGIVDEPMIAVDTAVQTAIQNKVTVNATQTAYAFTCGKVALSLTFTSPLLIHELDILARPVSYINASVQSVDGAAHSVQLYLGASTDIAANLPSQQMSARQYRSGSLAVLKAGTIAQPVLKNKGDDLRIDWGFMYIATSASKNIQQSISTDDNGSKGFLLSENNNLLGKHLVLNTTVNMGLIGNKAKNQLFLIGYDDRYSVQYFSQNLLPWWKQKVGASMEQQLTLAANEYPAIIKKCETLNHSIYNDAFKAGGKNYATICELAYRQTIAAHKLVKSPEGEILFYLKKILAMDPSIQ
jgi:hypothetical protein